jgi:Sec-independent protein secretion pathway component TatC
MYVLAEYHHHRWPAIRQVLQALSRWLLALLLAAATLFAGVVLGLVPWPSIGALSYVVLEVLWSQATSLGVHPFYRAPGEIIFQWLDTYVLVGMLFAMPALAYELLAAAGPETVRQRISARAMAVSGIWVAFVIGIVLGYAVVVPIAVPWIAGASAMNVQPPVAIMSPGVTELPQPPGLVWAPRYLADVSVLLILAGLLVEVPVAVFSLAKLAATNRTRMVWWRIAAIPLALTLATLLVGTQGPINVALVGLLAYLPFELGLLVARFADPAPLAQPDA